jgi:hypothetical protein
MTKRRSTLLAASTSFVAMLVLLAQAIVIPRAPTRSELARTWVGWFDDQRYFRLTLANDGTGLFGDYSLSEINPKPKLHKVSKWSLDGAELAMELGPVDPQAGPLFLTAHASTTMLQMKLAETNGWSCSALLRLEGEVDAAIQSTKQRMESYAASAKTK